MNILPIIDPRTVEDLRALNPGDNDEFLREIVGIFLDDTPRRITELEHSLSARDMTKFSRAAHSIKGSSSNLGASRLRAAAEAIEHHAKAQGLEGIMTRVETLKHEFDQVATALRALIAT